LLVVVCGVVVAATFLKPDLKKNHLVLPEIPKRFEALKSSFQAEGEKII
jgi:hypothetical protein